MALDGVTEVTIESDSKTISQIRKSSVAGSQNGRSFNLCWSAGSLYAIFSGITIVATEAIASMDEYQKANYGLMFVYIAAGTGGVALTVGGVAKMVKVCLKMRDDNQQYPIL